MNVSTGEPEGRWKAWGKWLRLLGVAVAGIWMQRHSEQDMAILAVMGAVLAVMCWRMRLTGQQIELLIEQHPVQLNLYTDISRRVWLEWKSRGAAGRSCIRAPYHEGWGDHALTLEGKQYSLRIFVKPFADGYLVSNYGRGFDMVVVRNTWTW